MKIINANICPPSQSAVATKAQVIATFEDGSIKSVFSFYPDEISFESSELVGLTEEEAIELHHSKDLSFLESCTCQLSPMVVEPEMATKPATKPATRRKRRSARPA